VGDASLTQLVAHNGNSLCHAFWNETNHSDGMIDPFAEDWDTVVILDTCRYDLFAERSTLDGRLKSRISRASATREWVWANFTGRALYDVVYVSANPNYRKVADEIGAEVHAYVDVWEDDYLKSDGYVVLPLDRDRVYARHRRAVPKQSPARPLRTATLPAHRTDREDPLRPDQDLETGLQRDRLRRR
jgi:hypothetical protein